MSSLVRRLNQVERELAASRARTKQQNDELALLRTQLAAAEARQRKGDLEHLKQQQRRRRVWGRNAAARSDLPEEDEEIARWRFQAKKAWRVVRKMKEFLQDYGLIWVGDDDDDNDNDSDIDGDIDDTDDVGDGNGGKSVRRDRSKSAPEDDTKLPSSSGDCTERQPNARASIRDGEDEPKFRTRQAADSTASDDGNGAVPQPPTANTDAIARPGILPLQRPPRHHPSNIHSLDTIDANAAKPQSKSSFLSKLPAAVIRNGKVIEVRSEIASILDPSANASGGADDGPIALTETIVGGLMRRSSTSTTASKGSAPALKARFTAASARPDSGGTKSADARHESGGDSGGRPMRDGGDKAQGRCADDGVGGRGREGGGDEVEVVTVQVKTEDRLQTYVLKLAATSTVGAIYRMIDKHRAGADDGSLAAVSGSSGTRRTYELRGGYPPRLYGNLDMTLTDAGLIPNASLFMTPSPSS